MTESTIEFIGRIIPPFILTLMLIFVLNIFHIVDTTEAERFIISINVFLNMIIITYLMDFKRGK